MRGIRGIVFGKTYQAAINELKSVDRRYELSEIHSVKKRFSKYDACIVYENGDIWKAVTANENARGHRANIVYIDRRINNDIINTIILPMLQRMPYCGVHYFIPDEREDIDG